MLVDSLFDNLAVAAANEELCFGSGKSRCATYLNASKRTEWENRSNAFVARRPDIVKKLSHRALYQALAVQHFVELDAVDANLPSSARISNDSYTNGVNDQLLRDATRCRYTVNRKVYNFVDVLSQETEAAFVKRFLSAVCCSTPQILLPRVTTVMSQSGFAALEKASLSKVTVSGGTQVLDCTLENCPLGSVVTLQVHREGFREYHVVDEDECTQPQVCDAESSLQKKVVIAFSMTDSIDVVELVDEIDIRKDGRSLPRKRFQREVPRIKTQTPLPFRCIEHLFSFANRRCGVN